MININLNSREPIYLQLKNKITKLAISGVYKADEKLPSVRSLAKDLTVNPNTVQKAYQDLERDGVIYSIPGKGSFISGNINKIPELIQSSKSQLISACKSCIMYGISLDETLSIIKQVYKTEEESK